ncbi:hypothetical protein WICPIJ_006090 [Wickerhamomyces pijperi]|uniref:Fe2OG dioxygenase domain-containing protein n=1 Tax=Wickerhamomyces pijperi TaxID=599730 RepID=A0A9P8TL71_WICPI|nr:hypothetical protein WICPIJ_006090 [Wickerhamomyces pijperi]
MPVAIVENTLTPDVINDNHNYDIPDGFHSEFIEPLIKEIRAAGISDPSSIKFDPARHIAFQDSDYAKTKRLTLTDLGVTDFHQEPITDIGVTEPFPLFTHEAVLIMRYEIFQKELFEKYGRLNNQSSTAADQNIYIRGYARSHAPFTKAAWEHPKTLEIMSKMSNVELEHQFDYEIGHINLSVKTPQTETWGKETTNVSTEEDQDVQDADEIPAVVTWHFDSPQMVCVLMLSDTSDMIGGETALIKGDGKVAKVEGPKQGWCNVLQGRILRHIAMKPKGNFKERVTSVCSFRPKDPLLDDSVITTVKPAVLSASRYNEFYNEWMNYRLDVLAKRIEILKNNLNEKFAKGEMFDQLEAIEFLQNKVSKYADGTWQEFEVVDDGLVERPASYNIVQARWD